MIRRLIPVSTKSSRSSRRSLDPWTSSPGALHFAGLRRGLFFFAAVLSLILPVAVAARCARPEPEISRAVLTDPVRNAATPLGAVLLMPPRSFDPQPR